LEIADYPIFHAYERGRFSSVLLVFHQMNGIQILIHVYSSMNAIYPAGAWMAFYKNQWGAFDDIQCVDQSMSQKYSMLFNAVLNFLCSFFFQMKDCIS
jgi:hypothetical protein